MNAEEGLLAWAKQPAWQQLLQKMRDRLEIEAALRYESRILGAVYEDAHVKNSPAPAQ